jgi:hypothetical protein
MEEFINLDDLINKIEEKKKIFQIQVSNNNFIFKYIGNISLDSPPDMIIKENFGINNSFNMYSILYEENELINYNNKIIPLIKITNKIDNYSICIKYNIPNLNNIIFNVDNLYFDFDLFFIYNLNNNIFNDSIDKNINSDNILEKLFELIIDKGIIIFDKS